MEDFKIRTYGWQELAILYAPDLTPESAGKRLSSWIRFNPKTYARVARIGMEKGTTGSHPASSTYHHPVPRRAVISTYPSQDG